MQACPAKWEIEEKAEAIMRHGHRLGVFFMASYYVFIALAGALLVTRKLNIVYYFCVIVLFNLTQAGIFILIKFINTYGGTELLNRVYAIVYQKLTVAVLVIPLFIVAGRYVFAQISASGKD